MTVLNGPGTIDADYRGEVGVILINLGRVSYAVARATRVAQLVVAPVARVRRDETGLDGREEGSGRGSGGFGSTGLELRRGRGPWRHEGGR